MNNTTIRKVFASSLRAGIALTIVSALTVPMFADTASPAVRKISTLDMGERIRKQLVTLPTYGVFDELSFQLDGSTVTLKGHASRPILKSDAERTVASVEGVKSVINKIEVLPVSAMDDSIRLKTYLAIYRSPGLQRYSTGSRIMPRLTPMWAAGGITDNPPVGWLPIHIIVQNGNVTLTGIVDREADKTIAGMAANQISGVFGVTNSLMVASGEPKHDNTNKADS